MTVRMVQIIRKKHLLRLAAAAAAAEGNVTSANYEDIRSRRWPSSCTSSLYMYVCATCTRWTSGRIDRQIMRSCPRGASAPSCDPGQPAKLQTDYKGNRKKATDLVTPMLCPGEVMASCKSLFGQMSSQ